MKKHTRAGALGAVVSIALLTSQAGAFPRPPDSDPVTSGTVITTPEGSFAFLYVTQSGASYVQLVLDGGRPGDRSVLSSTATSAIAAARARDASGAFVATASATSVTRYRLITSSTPVQLRPEDPIAAAGAGVALSQAQAGRAPFLAVLARDDASASLRPFDAPAGVTVPTPDRQLGGGALHAWSGGGGLFAYPTRSGARVVRLGEDGAPSAAPAIELRDRVPGLSASIVALGADALVTYWPNQSPEPHGPIAERFAADGTSLEQRTLEQGTLAVVADPDAPGGPDAAILRGFATGFGYEESSWNAQRGDAGPAPSARRLPTVQGRFVAGACSASGCLYVFSGAAPSTTYPFIWSPRAGAAVAGDLPAPAFPGGGGGGTKPVPSPTPTTTPSASPSTASPAAGAPQLEGGGCSASPVPAERGFLGALALAGALLLGRRRRAAH